MLLQPFVTYQLGNGWFVRSQPLMIFNVSCFIEPFWSLAHEGPAPAYGITVGVAFLYPGLWRGSP